MKNGLELQLRYRACKSWVGPATFKVAGPVVLLIMESNVIHCDRTGLCICSARRPGLVYFTTGLADFGPD